MLRIDKVEVIEGVTVYGDDALDYVFYPIPEAPRFRVDDKGQPIFKFLKYRMPIERAEGKKGGGFAFFDTEFTLTPAQSEAVKSALDARVAASHPGSGQPKEAQIGTITYLKGTANLLLSEASGTLIEAVKSAGKPSLFGKNISSFMVEFTPEGATLFEEALQGQGGVVQVVYDLFFSVKLPPLTASAWFNASKFYSFYQEIDIEWNMWSEDDYRETLRETFTEHEAMGVETNFTFALPDAEEDKKLKNRIRDMMHSSLEDAVERMMIEDIAPVAEEGRKPPEDIENVTRDLSVTKVASFSMNYQENTAIEWNFAPQGTLPNITTLSDNEGKAIVWSDYASEVDLDDPFFKQLNVTVAVNADFEKLPIHSIEVHLEYHQGDEHEIKEFVFEKPDDRSQFQTYIANDNWKYTYWYEVNYVGSSKTFTSEKIETDEQYLTINVDDIGIVAVDVQVGDLNFEQVTSAQVTVRYEETGVEPVEEQFALGAEPDKRTHLFQKLIFKPRTAPYRYRVDYFMKDGKQISADWVSADGSPLYINDPFGATKTVAVRGLGDFSKIGQIFVDLVYEDAANSYTQNTSVTLSAAGKTFHDWSFPVIGSGGGTVTYSGQIQYADGTVKEIPKTVADSSTVLVGEEIADRLNVALVPDLLDWDQVKLAKVSLLYEDPTNQVREATDFIFSPTARVAASWEVALKDLGRIEYKWKASYFLVDGTEKTVDWQTTTDASIVLQAPGVAPPTPPPAGGGEPVTPPAPPVTPGAGPTEPTPPATPAKS